jgi:exopolyphosphatase/pppGpp-phosphohydrolase
MKSPAATAPSVLSPENVPYDAAHPVQVAHLAMALFDGLVFLHRLDAADRQYLHYAALLHDIGIIEGTKGHHKRSQKIILRAGGLPFRGRKRQVVALVARYHRKALPSMRHELYAALESADRRRVRLLASLLRVADGLDVNHRGAVSGVSCLVTPARILITCDAGRRAEEERQRGLEKADLMEKVFRRRVDIRLGRR